MGLPKFFFNLFLFSALLLSLCPAVFSTTMILNSQDYQDVLSAAVYARHLNYNFVFALTPNQSVFISKYYTAVKNESIIYLEGKNAVLPNMGALIKDSGVQNLTSASPASVQSWIADRMGKDEAIIVGSQYGQDALAVSSYASLKGAPIFFVDASSASAGSVLDEVASRGYKRVIIYGAVGHQIDQSRLASFSSPKVIDTGNRYSNNIEIVKEFLLIKPARQAIFVSGYTFEKSMTDPAFPIFLVGRSDIQPDLPAFLSANNISSGVVFSGDSSIVDGVNKLKQLDPSLIFFVKFGEGYRTSAQPLPLMIIPLPSPNISLEVLNLTYNIPSKIFELQIANRGDFAAVSAGASVPNFGTGQSSQIYMDPNTVTTLPVPFDGTDAILGGKIASATLSIRYGEDIALMDNIEEITFINVPTSLYADLSSVKFNGVSYLSGEKAFALDFEGSGWAEGTIGFNINNKPVVLRIPLSKIDGKTQVKIKFLLTSDEEKFVDSVGSIYFIRSGQRQDLLLKESRGSSQVRLYSVPQISSAGIGGVSLPCIFGGVVALVCAFVFFKYFTGRKDSGGFD